MNYKQILKQFDTPAQMEINRLSMENQTLAAAILKNKNKILRLVDKADKEQDAVANRLDREFLNWRKVIVQELKSK